MKRATNQLHAAGGWQPILREIGVDAEAIFSHPEIRPWRTLPDRENCTLETDLMDGRHVRLHVKRYAATRGLPTAAQSEVTGHRLLVQRGIPTAELVAWGELEDRRAFVIFNDLRGYRPADKLIEEGAAFERLLEPTADLAARLHGSGLHHRDLYLCHFLAQVRENEIDLRLIDPARVRTLPRFLTGGRWIVKDLAQFWYSTLKLPITDVQREAWLEWYAAVRQVGNVTPLRRRIENKVQKIGRHDARLNLAQPTRNVSIPW